MKKSALFLLFFLVLLAGPARAQFFLEEAKVNLSVSGGDRINKSIVVDNTSSEPIDVKVYWEDFQYEAPYDGSKKFFPAGTVSGSAASWVQYLPQDFKLPPFGKQKIEYTINVPQQIEGGHYGVLFFEKTDGSSVDTTGVKVVTRVGCLFFIEARNKIKKAGLGDIAVAGHDLTGTFTNNGNVVLIPRTTYYMMDDSGMVVDRGELVKSYVPPGGSASWKLALPNGGGAGHYNLVLNADLDEGDLVVKEISLQKNSSGEFLVEKVQD